MTENKNRVCCLYRVSTDKQVDFNSNHEADLPMQRKACHKFAEAKGWVIVHEEQEEGVSGHKVRAEARDKLQIINLDLNMGCPVPKVVNNGEGSALMKDPKLVEQILTALVKAINKPVTVKIRKGFDDDHVNAVEIAKIAEACGVAAVAVHGRTRAQYYSGQADWDIIAQVKDAVKIPVIGNGDVDSPEKAKAILEQTGCDGVMIGRAAEGNPWIFREVVSYLANGTIPARPTNREKRELILRHAALQLEYKGEYTGVREMRKHLSWYTVGMPHSAHFRQTINTMEKMDELIRGVQEIFPDEV